MQYNSFFKDFQYLFSAAKMSIDFDPKILGGSVKRGIVNPDLIEERKKCDFDQQELAL